MELLMNQGFVKEEFVRLNGSQAQPERLALRRKWNR